VSHSGQGHARNEALVASRGVSGAARVARGTDAGMLLGFEVEIQSAAPKTYRAVVDIPCFETRPPNSPSCSFLGRPRPGQAPTALVRPGIDLEDFRVKT